jgi:4-hydroxy-tetrahydrodipicolinate synthase
MPAPLDLRGTFVAVTTPFRDDAIAEADLAAHLEHLLEAGVSGIVACGTTGEATTLTAREQRDVIRLARRVIGARVPLIAGTGTNCTAKTIETSHEALEAGADALLVVAPYYNRPTQEGLEAHYRAVVEATNAPVILYDVPGRTAVGIDVATTARLAEHGKVVGIKDATGDLRKGSSLLAAARTKLRVLSGDDFTAIPFMAIGAQGVISVVANVDPRRTVAMVDAALRGDFGLAEDLHFALLPLMELLFVQANPIPVKRAVSLLGFGDGSLRLPLTATDAALTERLRACMASLDLL